MIGGNGELFDLKTFAVKLVAFSLTFVWHKVGVVPNFLFKVLIGANFLAPLFCSHMYIENNKMSIKFEIQVCPYLSILIRPRNQHTVTT